MSDLEVILYNIIQEKKGEGKSLIEIFNDLDNELTTALNNVEIQIYREENADFFEQLFMEQEEDNSL